MKRTTMIQTKYGAHAIVLEQDEKRGYIATAADIEGVVTWGGNSAHAKEMVREAIELAIESLVKEQMQSTKTKGTRHHVHPRIAVPV